MNEAACASGDPHSTRAGADVLEAGGTAVDAALAAALMACFSAPTMSGVGGAGVMTIWRDGKAHVVDFFASLPGLGRAANVRPAFTPVEIEFDGVRQDFHIGAGSVAVPGTVAGLWHVHERFGTMPMRDLAGPVIRAAREGIRVSTSFRRAVRLLQPIFRHTPEAWSLVSKDDRLLEVGEIYRHEALADLLDALVREGPDVLYRGEPAKAIQEATGGGVTTEDLANYRVRETTPLSFSFRDATIHGPRAPSLTSALLARSMSELQHMPAAADPSDPAPHRTLIRAMKQGEVLRTPEYERRLLEEGYLDAIVAGSPGGSTLHCSTVDPSGGLVAYTTTLGEGCGVVAGSTGVHLNNFLGEDDIYTPESPHEPGTRMMTSTCPMVVVEPNGRRIALGAAGSKRIRTAIMQVLDNTLRRNCSLHESVARPRMHIEDGVLHVETFDRHIDELEAIRAVFREELALASDGGVNRLVESNAPGYFFGAVQAVSWSPTGIEAGADTARRGCESREVRVRPSS